MNSLNRCPDDFQRFTRCEPSHTTQPSHDSLLTRPVRREEVKEGRGKGIDVGERDEGSQTEWRRGGAEDGLDPVS